MSTAVMTASPTDARNPRRSTGYSSEIAWTKPHPEAFLAVMAAVGISDPAECVYVGDRPYEDVHGAQRVGMRTILIPHSDIPAAQQVPVDVRPDGVAHRLLDVLDLVDPWVSTT